MKTKPLAWLVLVLLSAAVSSGAEPSSGEPFRLRVLSYNIHHGEGVDGKIDLERIARVVMSVEPDVVALQELDQKTTRTGGVDQPAELARLIGKKVVFGDNIRYQGGQYGNAVLSGLGIKKHQNHLLPSPRGGERRGVLEVELELPGQEPSIVVLATHFDARPGDRERLESVQAIDKLVASRPEQPFLLVGDLNDVPTSPTLQAFGEQWTRANKEVLPTVPVEQPKRQIDYVLFRPSNRWKVVEARVLDESIASDHRPLLIVLEWVP